MQRVKRTEANVHDDATVTRLQREISFLKDVL